MYRIYVIYIYICVCMEDACVRKWCFTLSPWAAARALPSDRICSNCRQPASGNTPEWCELLATSQRYWQSATTVWRMDRKKRTCHFPAKRGAWVINMDQMLGSACCHWLAQSYYSLQNGIRGEGISTPGIPFINGEPVCL